MSLDSFFNETDLGNPRGSILELNDINSVVFTFFFIGVGHRVACMVHVI